MSTRTDLLAALAAIDSEIQAAEERVADLRLERRGAEALLRRLRVSTADPEFVVPESAGSSSEEDEDTERPPAGDVIRKLAPGNARYVADILATAPDGLTLAVIEAKMSQRGKPLNNDQVRSAVTYLKRKGVAETAARGVWRLIVTDPATDADSPAESAGLSVLTIPTTEGGEAGAASASDREDHLSRWNDRNGHHPSVMEG